MRERVIIHFFLFTFKFVKNLLRKITPYRQYEVSLTKKLVSILDEKDNIRKD